MRAESEKNSLKEKINDLNSKVGELNNNLRDKERTIQDLNKKLVSFLSKQFLISFYILFLSDFQLFLFIRLLYSGRERLLVVQNNLPKISFSLSLSLHSIIFCKLIST